jgi:hypothetical protein
MLHWSAMELANSAGVHVTTIQRLEASPEFQPLNGTIATLKKVIGTLERAGIEFMLHDDYAGVQMKISGGKK